MILAIVRKDLKNRMERKQDILNIYVNELQAIKEAGLFKGERPITSSQGSRVTLSDGRSVLNMCANNYLGLANNRQIIDAAKRSYEERGYGLSSVRFICGTQDIHKNLEKTISHFLGTEDTILYSSCFDANGGLFETILTEADAVISDELNHASIIDGIRLCKAKRYRYKNNNMEDLRNQLREADAAGARIKLIATDGVFSMDGIIADLKSICDIADEFNALVMVDDSHAVGFVGKTGRGSIEYCGVRGRVDIITGTLGKALGGASGGYTSGRKEIIDLLRQRSRPYLFSNTLAPSIVCASLEVFHMLEQDTSLRDRLEVNTAYYRGLLTNAGFDIVDGVHPIVPIMLYDEKTAVELARRMMEKGVYVVAFSYPVVPKGKARIRTQVSAAHTKEDIDYIVSCFIEARAEMKLQSPNNH
jgi:glycine C-acetyltransferase